jgi:hypothetical protein
MRALVLALAAILSLPGHAQSASTSLTIEFSNPGLTPSRWTLVIHPDGSGHFHAERGHAADPKTETMEPATIDRDVHLNEDFVDRVFDTVHSHHLMDVACESRAKVAFQGWKTISYRGPDGSGICRFNYSNDKEIEALGDSLVGVASTIVEGVRLEMIRQHDPLGLDREMEFVTEASRDGRLQQICVIQKILQSLEEDPAVLDRVRTRARKLLARVEK